MAGLLPPKCEQEMTTCKPSGMHTVICGMQQTNSGQLPVRCGNRKPTMKKYLVLHDMLPSSKASLLIGQKNFCEVALPPKTIAWVFQVVMKRPKVISLSTTPMKKGNTGVTVISSTQRP